MKYPGVRCAMPAGVCEWLERELEQRGIDAVVYARYVLSLLRRDAPPPDKGRPVCRRRPPRFNQTPPDLEQLRRSAAVDCLASACDQKCGIESLVDELCQKLKDFESEAVESTQEVPKSRHESDESDPAARYYAAFPALGTNRHQTDRTDTNRHQTNLTGDEGYSTNSDHETCRTDDLDLEYEDLPVDIRGLLASPVTPTTPVRRRDLPTQQNRPYIRCGTNITSSIWSQDVEDIVQQTVSVSRWSDGGDRRTVSLMQLNHGCESCFAEVLPGVLPKNHVVPQVRLPIEVSGTEEDLLTSSRTHFRPIKHDESFGSSLPGYADGTTFQIRGSLERVNYKRTESGGYYLQREGFNSPDRYLEWKPNTPVLTDAFIPRFRLSQNEKCCQTDLSSLNDVPRLESIVGEETPPPKRRVLSGCEYEDDFFFPGDTEQLLHEQWRTGTCCTKCNADEIWGAACVSCAPPISTKACDLRRLRDELSREGDQLLSDLQRIVMLPGAEIPPQTQPPPGDYRKRRYSGAPACAGLRPIWPPAAIQLQSLLRPVTLNGARRDLPHVAAVAPIGNVKSYLSTHKYEVIIK